MNNKIPAIAESFSYEMLVRIATQIDNSMLNWYCVGQHKPYGGEMMKHRKVVPLFIALLLFASLTLSQAWAQSSTTPNP